MSFTPQDYEFMAQALQLAERGRYTVSPNPQVGCVLVNGGKVVGQGWHQRAGEAHAEVMALKNAEQSAVGATAYVTLEPCCHHGRTPPCTDALINAGIKRVIFASSDPNPQVAGQGASQLVAAGISVDSGLLAAEADKLNEGFFKRMQTGMPLIRSKIAASLDGRTALASGESKWITGEAAREDVQRLRAASCAILTGIGTVLADDPSLNVRDTSLGDVKQPLRVIADSHLRTPPSAKIFKAPGQVLIFALEGASGAQLQASGIRVEYSAADQGRIDLQQLLAKLAKEQINEVLVEAGSVLNGALLASGLIDELIVYTAAHILGDQGRAMFSMSALEQMQDRVCMRLAEVRQVGDDVRATYRRM